MNLSSAAPSASPTDRSWRTSWPGIAAFGWVVVFFLFHIYWYAGGRFGFGDIDDPIPEWSWSIKALAFSAITTLAFPVGAAVALASIRPWGRRFPRRLILTLLWAGCIVLVLRGGAGLLDDGTRTSRLLEDGITGIPDEELYSDPTPSAYTLWSSRAMDTNFFVGGVLFGLAALRFSGRRPGESPPGRRAIRTDDVGHPTTAGPG